MTRHPAHLPTLALAPILGALAQRWTQYLSELGRRINAAPMPRHHRLGSWQATHWPPRAPAMGEDVERQS